MNLKFKKNQLLGLTVLIMAPGLFTQKAAAQKAEIRETRQNITTYPFGDPNPVPALARSGRNKIYPYFTFDGYAVVSEEKKWTVVDLENEYIKVSVLPEVGGKIWGAVEKTTGKEFIYLNDVLKFRNIAMRGPWTSGGIEFNFGIIGHAPSTATPVDYILQENADGSVSCIVGGLDLPSRTVWRVAIHLPKDKAYFETKSLWYNPTPLNTSYYQWMNAAIKAADDLQFYFPGEFYISHDGEAHTWPLNDEGIDLSYYKNNAFGGNKSYHVLGKYTHHSGAYYHKEDFGYGHWSSYNDMPGKKIWIWSLARSGAIWEDLLTDKDGQYVEVQSGRLFSQANDRSGKTPFNQVGLAPLTADTWRELWFPVKGIGGITDASPTGVLNVVLKEDTLKVAVNALQHINDSLNVIVDGHSVFSAALSLSPMDVYTEEVILPSKRDNIKVYAGSSLSYSSNHDRNNIKRPLQSPEEYGKSGELAFQNAEDAFNSRDYGNALLKYLEVLEKEPAHSLAKIRVAEIYFDRGRFDEALKYLSEVLALNTYDPHANFLYGVIHRSKGDYIHAKEALGWAARSMAFRSAAYAQMAGIFLQESKYQKAVEYALRSLNFNQFNMNGRMMLSIGYRKLQRQTQAEDALAALLELDPLNHFARFEQYLLNPSAENLSEFKTMIRNELPHETYLELTMHYVKTGLDQEAIRLLEEAPDHPVVNYWLAYLYRNHSQQVSKNKLLKAQQLPQAFAFPFRPESIPVLEWAAHQDDAWQTKYYLGLLYWSKDRADEARECFMKAGDEPDFAPFYLTRAKIMKGRMDSDEVLADLKQAVEISKDEWRTWHALFNHYNEFGRDQKALEIANKAYDLFTGSYIIGMDYAKALLTNGQYEKTLDLLGNLNILPYEGAREGHRLYRRAGILLAIEKIRQEDYQSAVKVLEASKEWPENLGVGKPYHPDVRLQNYLAAHVYRRLGNKDKADELLTEIYNYTKEREDEQNINRYLGALVLNIFDEGKEAELRLKQWETSREPERILHEWITAKIKNNDREARRVAEKMKSGIPPGSSDLALVMKTIMLINIRG